MFGGKIWSDFGDRFSTKTLSLLCGFGTVHGIAKASIGLPFWMTTALPRFDSYELPAWFCFQRKITTVDGSVASMEFLDLWIYPTKGEEKDQGWRVLI